MDYRLDDEHEALRKTVEEFAHEVVAPVIGELLRARRVPLRRSSGRWARWGCSGCRSRRSTAAWAATTSRSAWPSRSWPGSTPRWRSPWRPAVSLGAMPIYRFGTEEQKREWLPRLCAGEALGAFGLTEPGGGSDAGGTRTTARLDGRRVGHQRHARRSSPTPAPTSPRWSPSPRSPARGRTAGKEISSIIVPSGTPGFTVGQQYSKVGWNASDTHELSFADCRVPAANLLGERGRGYAQFLPILDEGRIAIAALAHRAGPGLRRRVGAVRQAARGVRPADRPQPGDPVQDRRHGGAGAHRPAGLLRRRGPDAARRAVQAARRRSPSCTPPRSRWTTPARPPRSTAATAS